MAKSKKSSGNGRSPRARVRPRAVVTISYFAEKTEVKIRGWENVSPGKIQKSFGLVFREWQRLRALFLQSRNKYELDRQEREAAQGKGIKDAA